MNLEITLMQKMIILKKTANLIKKFLTLMHKLKIQEMKKTITMAIN